MTERVNPFASLSSDLPAFKPREKAQAAVQKEAVEQVAEESGFRSRQPSRREKPSPKHKPRTYRTGRNIQFNSKVTQETQDKIYRMADETGIKISELLEMAFNALERERPQKPRS